MSEVNFLYDGFLTKIQCTKGQKMKDLCQKFATKMNVNLNDVCFLHGGQSLDDNLECEEYLKNTNNNSISILVNNINDNEEEKNRIIVSKDVICPICFEPCRINIEDYKITLYECKGGHKTENILLNDFRNKQKIDQSKIICNNCNQSKNNIYENKFYKCFTCKFNLCPMCRDKHDNLKHKIIDYDEINYKCGKHNNKFISYCEKCRENLCMLCERDHDKKYQKKHNTLYYKELLANIEDINTEILKLKSKIDKIKKYIDDMIKMFNEVKVNIDKFSDINLTILKNYDENNIN
jgi:hypothetical protein